MKPDKTREVTELTTSQRSSGSGREFNATVDASIELEAAGWILEQFASESGNTVERSRIRRTLNEAASAWPGPVSELWWRWLAESTQSLGYRCRIVDCIPQQLLEMTRDGARVISRVDDDDGRWFAVFGASASRLALARPLHEPSVEWVSPARLPDYIGVPGPEPILRCVVVDPMTPVEGADSVEHKPMSPWERLVGLLHPEMSDVWVIALFSVIVGVLAMATPLAVETLVNTVAFGRFMQPVVVLALILFGFLAFSASLLGLQKYAVEIIQRRMFARIAADLAYRLPRVRGDAFNGSSGRELVNRFFDVVTIQKAVAQLLLDGLTLVMATLVGMLVLAFYHPWLLGFDLVLLALIAFIIFVMGRGAVKTSIKESKNKYRVAAWLEDLAGCSTAFRYDGAPEFAMEKMDRLIHDYLMARKKHFRILMRQIIFALTLQSLASTVLLGLGGWLVISGQLTLGQLVAAELIVAIIVGSFAKLGKHIESFYDLLAGVDKMGVLFDLPLEQREGILNLPNSQPAEVSVNNVSCSSSDGSSILEGFNLHIEPGQRLMIPCGSGHQTTALCDLIFDIRQPDSGHITLNQVNARSLRPDVLRNHVALVRDIEIFEGSIAENVHLERPDISSDDVLHALEEVGLLKSVLQFPKGIETQLTPGGHPLSVNQSRLLMFARAIVGRPSLLLVDGLLDCLSDDEMVRMTKMLADRGQPWTLLIVSGRAALEQYMDKIVRWGSSESYDDVESRNSMEVNHAG